MPKPKLIPIPKLIKKCHNAWSEVVRARDGMCMMCHKSDNLHAHHCIVPQKRGNSTRFLLDNGVALCYYCHMFQIHSGMADKDWLDRYVALLDCKVPKERQDEITRLSHEVKKYSREELTELIAHFKELTEKYKGEKI